MPDAFKIGNPRWEGKSALGGRGGEPRWRREGGGRPPGGQGGYLHSADPLPIVKSIASIGGAHNRGR